MIISIKVAITDNKVYEVVIDDKMYPNDNLNLCNEGMSESQPSQFFL